MTKIYTETRTVRNLYAYLLRTEHDEIRIRTSYVKGGWHDNEFDANAAGFHITRYIDKEYEAMHQFPECYHLTRM